MAHARIRTIKPEIWTSLQFVDLSQQARLCFIALITLADDAGRGSAEPRKLKITAYAADQDMTAERINQVIKELEAQGLIATYDGGPDGRLYVLPTWFKHQAMQKAKASTYPEPPEQLVTPEYLKNARALPERKQRKSGTRTVQLRDEDGTSTGHVQYAYSTRTAGSDPIRSEPILNPIRSEPERSASPAPSLANAAPAPRLKAPGNKTFNELHGLEPKAEATKTEAKPVPQPKAPAEPKAQPGQTDTQKKQAALERMRQPIGRDPLTGRIIWNTDKTN